MEKSAEKILKLGKSIMISNSIVLFFFNPDFLNQKADGITNTGNAEKDASSRMNSRVYQYLADHQKNSQSKIGHGRGSKAGNAMKTQNSEVNNVKVQYFPHLLESGKNPDFGNDVGQVVGAIQADDIAKSLEINLDNKVYKNTNKREENNEVLDKVLSSVNEFHFNSNHSSYSDLGIGSDDRNPHVGLDVDQGVTDLMLRIVDDVSSNEHPDKVDLNGTYGKEDIDSRKDGYNHHNGRY